MIVSLFNHLWQSTLFASLAGLLTIALRRYPARARFWLWFAASVKFLLPFSLLVTLGNRLAPRAQLLAVAEPVTYLAGVVSTPFVKMAPILDSTRASTASIATVLLALWLSGAVVVLTVWTLKWLRLRKLLLKAASPVDLAAPIPVKSVAAPIEPGLVGVWRPVLLLPEGLTARLSSDEMHSFIAHELCHLRRHDNLTAAIHMAVEALFWFYPLTWWLGTRLVAEREHACDESVVTSGHDPQVYAGGLLKVCRFCVQAPLLCAAGVSGADLKGRIRVIMSASGTRRLSAATQLSIVLAGVFSLAAPLCYGLMSATATAAATQAAQTAEATPPTAAEIARRLYEQTRPRTEVPFEPAAFDKFVGYYRFDDSDQFAHIYRIGSHYFAQMTGQSPVENFPESPTQFFATIVAAQISFDVDAGGRVTGLVVHQNGLLHPAARVPDATYDAVQAKLASRIKANEPSPGTEASLRRWIASMEAGHPNYDNMGAGLAAAARAQASTIAAGFHRLGAFHSLKFARVAPNGWDGPA